MIRKHVSMKCLKKQKLSKTKGQRKAGLFILGDGKSQMFRFDDICLSCRLPQGKCF